MDRDGLILEVYHSVERIYQGRLWLHMEGLEPNGRVSYQDGLETAMESFQMVQSQAQNDLQQVLLAEQTFIMQELQYCDSSWKYITLPGN